MASLRNLALLLGAVLPAAVLAAPAPAPVNTASQQSVTGRYIITLKNGIDALDFDSHLNWVRDVHKRSLESRGSIGEGMRKIFQFDTFNAYAAELDDTLLELIKLSKDVLGIEEEQVFSLANAPAQGLHKRELTTQKNATWGLGTISHREKGSKEYVYDDSAGEGTWAYVIDSGVRTTHEEFEGRAEQGYNALPETGEDDGYGHGTHVSGTIAGKTVGVAKKANIVSIKTFDPKALTHTADILDGINWAVNDITEKGRKEKAVINMSLTGGSSEALDNAVNSAFNAGVLVVVAAGNNGDFASEWSPARAEKAFTVGSIDDTWGFSSFSNHGPEVNILAPGRSVYSAYAESDSDYFEDSGTSMASPHVAGVAAYLMAKEGGSAADIKKRIVELATSDAVPDTKESANKILYNGNDA